MTAGIARGDKGAFSRFYEIWFDPLHRYLLVVSGGREEIVADALQDTMMRVIRNARPFDRRDAFWNWLRRVARTALIDQVRKSRKKGAPIPLDALESTAEAEPSEDPTEELKGHLADCLDSIEPGERRLVEGKYYEGKSHAVLAEELDVSSKAIESRLARIRRKLKGMIVERLKR
jgi:RNA polymerase sigma-70 factor (ECF subfamily)